MGRKKLNVILVGLPLFTRRLESELKQFDPDLEVVALDTYYRFFDKLRAFLMVPFCDVVYSINGSLSRSRVFDWCLFWKKGLMMTWVGSDIQGAKKEGNPVERYRKEAWHFCEVEWIRQELQSIGIDAKILNFFNFEEDKTSAFPNPADHPLTVLSYLGAGKEKIYGYDRLLFLAERFPDIEFRIAGSEGEGLKKPDNLHFLGWVDDMKAEFDRTHITARIIEHDGLSGFVLESLLYEKHVLYSKPLDHCLKAFTEDECLSSLSALHEDYKQGVLKPNTPGRELVLKEFAPSKILHDLVEAMRRSAAKPST